MMSYCPDCGASYAGWAHGCSPYLARLGVQQAFDLRAAGYREPSPETPTYPYLP